MVDEDITIQQLNTKLLVCSVHDDVVMKAMMVMVLVCLCVYDDLVRHYFCWRFGK